MTALVLLVGGTLVLAAGTWWWARPAHGRHEQHASEAEADSFVAELRGLPAPGKEVVLPAWVVEALNGHDGVDACVESIVARTVSVDG